MMKHGLVIVLLGLLAVWAAPASGRDLPVELTPDLLSEAVPFEMASDAAKGPTRDPYGEDWIIFDDGSGPTFYPSPRLYARTVFTPNTDFRLQGVRVCPGNWRNSNGQFNVYVYEQNQQNQNLGDQVYTARLNQLPQWSQNMEENWQDFEFDEGEYIEFAAGVSFSVIYGQCPGGDQNQQGTGYWPIIDGATAVNRSYIAIANQGAPPPASHVNWTNGQTGVQTPGDLLIRANGEYLADFVDVGVVEVFNGDPEQMLTGQYLMYPGTQQTFKAQVYNAGSDVDVFVANFIVKDGGDNEVFNFDQVVEQFNGGDTLIIQCEEAWSTETTGRYRVFCTLQAGDDSNPDNDQASLDQIVFDPREDADAWLGYTDTTFETSISGEDSQTGWAAMFNHPGGEDLLWLSGYRAFIEPGDAAEFQIVFMVARIDLVQRQLTTVRTDTLWTDNSGEPQWVEMVIENVEDYITFQPNEAVMVTYISADGTRITIDSDAPTAGVNGHMPSSMMISFDGGNGYSGANSGDYGIEVQLGVSNAAPDGALLKIIPDTLNFGAVEPGIDHTIDAQFISRGSDSVRVTAINIPPGLRDFVSVSQQAFALASRETTIVTITFRADVDTTLSNQLLVSSNWEGHSRYFWPFRATTSLNVNEHVRPGLPGSYTLEQNFPNPFNPTTTIGFALVKAGEVTFGVYDMNGRLVSDMFSGRLEAGYHSFDFDASNLPAGIYTYRLNAGDYSNAKKMVLMK